MPERGPFPSRTRVRPCLPGQASQKPLLHCTHVGAVSVFQTLLAARSPEVAVAVVLQEEHAEEQTGGHGQEKI